MTSRSRAPRCAVDLPRMTARYHWAGLEWAILVESGQLLRMFTLVPGGMWGRVMHAQVKWGIALRLRIEELEPPLGDDVGQIARILFQTSVTDDVGAVVTAPAVGEEMPIGKAFLWMETVAEVPFATDTTDISMGRQDLRIGS